jgi:hypothetical protein
MGADSMGSPGGSRGGLPPYGTRPYGTRPYGTRPSDDLPRDEPSDEERPYGTRPYGTRPYGTRPYGTRPYGTRPYGTRPYGTRPYGTRPYGTREDFPEGALDPDEWADDVAELFCSSSAVVQLGASVVLGDGRIPVPSIEDDGVAQYFPRPPGEIDPCANPGDFTPGAAEKPSTYARRRILHPQRHELAVKVVLPDASARLLAERPELGWALKRDLADDLAVAADRAFLRGAPQAAEPCGITNTAGIDPYQPGGNPPDILAAFRELLARVRAANAPFRAPGWILGPAAVSVLTTLLTVNGRTEAQQGLTLDAHRLIRHYEDGGGLLFGYPFQSTRAAEDQVFFSADWNEAWIGADHQLVAIDVSTDAQFQTDETVIRAVMCHDFLVRRPRAFGYMVPPAEQFPIP